MNMKILLTGIDNYSLICFLFGISVYQISCFYHMLMIRFYMRLRDLS